MGRTLCRTLQIRALGLKGPISCNFSRQLRRFIFRKGRKPRIIDNNGAQAPTKEKFMFTFEYSLGEWFTGNYWYAVHLSIKEIVPLLKSDFGQTKMSYGRRSYRCWDVPLNSIIVGSNHSGVSVQHVDHFLFSELCGHLRIDSPCNAGSPRQRAVQPLTITFVWRDSDLQLNDDLGDKVT
jgi:hypothetical protein